MPPQAPSVDAVPALPDGPPSGRADVCPADIFGIRSASIEIGKLIATPPGVRELFRDVAEVAAVDSLQTLVGAWTIQRLLADVFAIRAAAARQRDHRAQTE